MMHEQRAASRARETYDLVRAKVLYQRALALVDVDHISVLLPVLPPHRGAPRTGPRSYAAVPVPWGASSVRTLA